MKAVKVEGMADPINILTRKRVLDALLSAHCNVTMACGGKGLCATCHVYVEKGAEQLTPQTPREALSLKMLREVRPTSRLACQAKVLGEGVQVKLPDGAYLSATSELESLIGRRAEKRILHPVDGRVLVEPGKIITRSRITELTSVDIDVAEMKRRSDTVA